MNLCNVSVRGQASPLAYNRVDQPIQTFEGTAMYNCESKLVHTTRKQGCAQHFESLLRLEWRTGHFIELGPDVFAGRWRHLALPVIPERQHHKVFIGLYRFDGKDVAVEVRCVQHYRLACPGGHNVHREGFQVCWGSLSRSLMFKGFLFGILPFGSGVRPLWP